MRLKEFYDSLQDPTDAAAFDELKCLRDAGSGSDIPNVVGFVQGYRNGVRMAFKATDPSIQDLREAAGTISDELSELGITSGTNRLHDRRDVFFGLVRGIAAVELKVAGPTAEGALV